MSRERQPFDPEAAERELMALVGKTIELAGTKWRVIAVTEDKKGVQAVADLPDGQVGKKRFELAEILFFQSRGWIRDRVLTPEEQLEIDRRESRGGVVAIDGSRKYKEAVSGEINVPDPKDSSENN